MELKELFPVEEQSLTGVSRDSCAGCVDELSSHRSLPSAPGRFSGTEEGAQGVSPAPQHLWGWGGSLHSLPLQQLVFLEVCADLVNL